MTAADFRALEAERHKAVGELLMMVACKLAVADEVMLSAEQVDDEDKDALIEAARGMMAVAGQLADRAARALGGSGYKPVDAWIHAPVAVDALKLLEARP